MAITYIGSASGTNTATMPAHIAGDLILVFAYRDGSNTAPSLASGYTSLSAAGANTNSMQIGKLIATTSSHTVGTWTNATSTIVAVYRGAADTGNLSVGSGASTTLSFNAVTPLSTTGDSWFVGAAGTRSVNTTVNLSPTGMTNRISVLDATDEMAQHDTNGGIASWATTTQAVGGTSSGWRTAVVELIVYVPPPPFSTTNCYASSWFAGSTLTPNNALGASDGVYTTNTTLTAWYGQWYMTPPPAALGTRLQTVNVYCRSSAAGIAYLDSLDIYYNNTLLGVGTLTSASNETSGTTGIVISYTFPGSWVTSLDLVQIGIYGVGGAAALQIDAIEWVANHDVIASGPGTLKYWNGTTWTSKTLKYWNGTTWTSKTLKYWNGTTWN